MLTRLILTGFTVFLLNSTSYALDNRHQKPEYLARLLTQNLKTASELPEIEATFTGYDSETLRHITFHVYGGRDVRTDIGIRCTVDDRASPHNVPENRIDEVGVSTMRISGCYWVRKVATESKVVSYVFDSDLGFQEIAKTFKLTRDGISQEKLERMLKDKEIDGAGYRYAIRGRVNGYCFYGLSNSINVPYGPGTEFNKN